MNSNNPIPLFIIYLLFVLPIQLNANKGEITSLPLRAPSEQNQNKPFEKLDPLTTNVNVSNVYDDPDMWGKRFREFTLGAIETGVAVADFDGDGQLDIFAVSKNGPCALYKQILPFQFINIATPAGVTCPGPANNTGATAVDINQDGFMDLYVCRLDAPNLLFINNGDATFIEKAADHGLDINDASVHATFADYDRDGDLDCYLVTNIRDFSINPQGQRDYLLANDGAGKFEDVTRESGIWGVSQGHAAKWFDANSDGWPDLYIANDFETPDRFYLNQGDGSFVDAVDQHLPHVTYFSMSVDSGDLNNDGRIDFIVSDMRDRTHEEYMAGMEEIGRGLWETERVMELIPQYPWNAVYIHSGTDHYLEAAHINGMEATGWTFGTRLADFDMDGYLDAFFATGMVRNFMDADLVDRQNRARTLSARANVWKRAAPRLENSRVFRSRGGQDAGFNFEDVTDEWGLSDPSVSFGCALADFDNDGDQDLVYVNYDAPPTIIRNNHTNGHRISVELKGKAPNLNGIGAEIRLESSSGIQVRQLFTERGIVSSDAPVVLFGIGKDKIVKRLTVRWPEGEIQTFTNLQPNRSYRIWKENLVSNTQSSQTAHPSLSQKQWDRQSTIHLNPPTSDTLLHECAAKQGLDLNWKLSPFDELTRQRLLPRRLNGLGPALAAGDVNQDGLQDLFVSGSRGESGAMFFQKKEGTFEPAQHQPWKDQHASDDVAAKLFDVDGDRDLDLIIVAGGIAYKEGDEALDDRIYYNDGQGRFSSNPTILPSKATSGGAITVADFDEDGDIDIFIGGRVVPGKYPENPTSFLLRQDKGTFVDVTDELAPGLSHCGMVTDAQFADIDNNGSPDLVVSLEWGPVMLWLNQKGQFQNITKSAGLEKFSGWWNALEVTDINHDGKLDIIAGNNGLNTKYRAKAETPLVLLSGEFDDSGQSQIIEAYTAEDGRMLPMRGRSKLSYAFPWINQRFKTYEDYARASIEDIFGSENLKKVQRLEATELASGVFINRGESQFEGKEPQFEFKQFPRLAQLAPINDWTVLDIDGDTHLDLIGVGNHFGPEPRTGRFDGNLGIVMKGDGKGDFHPLLPGESGLVVTGDARSAVPLQINDPSSPRSGIAVARTQGPLLLFTPANK